MTGFHDVGVAVIGTGFIGTVHLWALRRLGVRVTGMLGSSAGRGAERAAALGVHHAYNSLEQLLADPAVDVVHVTSPNHAHFAQVKAILTAGKHVICEKPLAMNSAESAEMVALAEASGLVAAVCYNTRFYPLSQQACGMVAAGKLGEVRLISGHYHQDWLAKPSDWNWRLETEEGGTLRSVADIGTHWVDLTSFIGGLKPVAVLAELATFIPERQRPLGPVETFAKTGDRASETRRIETDDAGLMLLRFANGARGSVTTSQVSHGRKNAMSWEVSGSQGSASWHSEHPDHLWLGHRDEPNQILQRDPGLMNGLGAAAASLPGGHVEGFADTFFALFRAVYSDVLAGGRSAGSNYASFEDGHYEMLFCDAVITSAKESRWVEVEGQE
ncbi:Gfo/Idh/MocA family protein [Devosia psychrophila]|uniref:Dehydrogenase n=1 Tax=Devosia psychrophila TaxID=728005 RepID=A0A0F5PW18_9HYPH|nr:Gfo/Idh/MocA family oxidoreductase [Devosia psychrophila]KKC32800.1 dehydrogenase [Devosia psychrophila]SFD21195.1 Predicted dehydrogenase [Devosia psychrophila]